MNDLAMHCVLQNVIWLRADAERVQKILQSLRHFYALHTKDGALNIPSLFLIDLAHQEIFILSKKYFFNFLKV